METKVGHFRAKNDINLPIEETNQSKENAGSNTGTLVGTSNPNVQSDSIENSTSGELHATVEKNKKSADSREGLTESNKSENVTKPEHNEGGIHRPGVELYVTVAKSLEKDPSSQREYQLATPNQSEGFLFSAVSIKKKDGNETAHIVDGLE